MIDDLPPLSERELEVLKLVATGATNQQIAHDLVISPNTVKVHLRNIFEKLGVQSRTEATMEAVRRGWVCIEGAVIVEGVAITPPETPAASPEPEPLAPPAPPIGLWQRMYMLVAACAVVLALLLPGWWQARSDTRRITAFTDVGQPSAPPAARQPASRWTARAPLPEGRSRLALVAAKGKLYAIGGETASGVSNQVTIYDPASNGWLPGTHKPTPVANVTGALLGDRIFVPGGTLTSTADNAGDDTENLAAASAQRPAQNVGVTGVVEIYDPQTDTWSSAAPLPAPRAAYGLAVLGNRLYLFGGWDGTRYSADTFIYDPQNNTWTRGKPMPSARAFMAAAPLKDLIYVAGGYDGHRDLKIVEAYDPQGEGTPAGPWSAKAPLNQPRAGLSLLGLGARLYAIGGGWNNDLAFNEQYDVVSGAWSNIGSPIVDQWRNLGLAAQGEKIYAVGGWSGGYLSNNEEYQAIFRVLIPASSAGQ